MGGVISTRSDVVGLVVGRVATHWLHGGQSGRGVVQTATDHRVTAHHCH